MNRRQEPPRRVDQPEVGFFTVKLVKGGPLVPARIFRMFGFWHAEVSGASAGLGHPDPAQASGVFRIWTTGTRITEAQYQDMLRTPTTLDPTQAICVGSQPPVF